MNTESMMVPWMCLFNQFLTALAGTVVKAQEALPSFAKFYHDCVLKSFSAIFHFLLKHYVIADSIGKLDAVVRSFRQKSMDPAEYGQELLTKTLSCGSVYDEKFLTALFLGEVTHLIRKTLRHWSAEHQHASVHTCHREWNR